jgi:pimeloyl-ACP methyl ester carboxylesterase
LPVARVNGVGLYYELSGSGDPLVLVHGSWVDHHSWDPVVGSLAGSFQVLTYDRRGHGRSEQPDGQGSVFEDADDLAALIEALDLVPAHVAGNSFGAVVALRAAVRVPRVFRGLIAHEPPLFPLLAGSELEAVLVEVQRRVGAIVTLLERPDNEAAARLFVDTMAFGPDAWDSQLTPQMRDTYVVNAPTFLDECRDRDALQMDLDALARLDKRVLLTSRSESAPFFGPVLDIVASHIPHAERITIDGADHAPHVSAPDRYVELVTTFANAEPAIESPSGPLLPTLVLSEYPRESEALEAAGPAEPGDRADLIRLQG